MVWIRNKFYLRILKPREASRNETQKEKTYFADYTLKANELKKAIYLDNRKRGLFKRQMILLILIAVLFAYFGVYQFIVIPRATPPFRNHYGGSGLLRLFFSLVSTSK